MITRPQDVKVTLQRLVLGGYKVARMTGRITLEAASKVFRAGDVVNDDQAEALNSIYNVTVLAVKE